jgi:hypothetical protein
MKVFYILLILTTFLNALQNNYDVPKKKYQEFVKITNNIYYYPFDSEKIIKLLYFVKQNKLTINNSGYKSLYTYILSNTNHPSIKNRLKKEFNIPLNYRLKNELNSFTFENLFLHFSLNNKKEEKDIRDYLENNKNAFQAKSDTELYYKLLYYLNQGNQKEAEVAFERHKDLLIKKFKEKQKEIKLKEDLKKDNKNSFLSEKSIVLRNLLIKNKLKKIKDSEYIILSNIFNIGSFLYRYTDEEQSNVYSRMSLYLLEDKKDLYFYKRYMLYSIFHEYELSIKNLEYIQKNHPYFGILKELIYGYKNAAEKSLSNKKYKLAWELSKAGLNIGLSTAGLFIGTSYGL